MKQNSSAGGDRTGRTGGSGKGSSPAIDLSKPISEFDRLTASGEIEHLSDAEFNKLANAANAAEAATGSLVLGQAQLDPNIETLTITPGDTDTTFINRQLLTEQIFAGDPLGVIYGGVRVTPKDPTDLNRGMPGFVPGFSDTDFYNYQQFDGVNSLLVDSELASILGSREAIAFQSDLASEFDLALGKVELANTFGNIGVATGGALFFRGTKLTQSISSEGLSIRNLSGSKLVSGSNTVRTLVPSKFTDHLGQVSEVYQRGNAVVKLSKVNNFLRPGGIEFTDSLKSELSSLLKARVNNQSQFVKGSEGANRIKELQNLARNSQKKHDANDILNRYGIENTEQGNNVIFDHLLDVGQTINQTNRVRYPSLLGAPKGNIGVNSTWTILPDGRAFLSTVHLTPK